MFNKNPSKSDSFRSALKFFKSKDLYEKFLSKIYGNIPRDFDVFLKLMVTVKNIILNIFFVFKQDI